MGVWFEGTNILDVGMEDVAGAVSDVSHYFLSVVRYMPGIASVEIKAKGLDFVTIQTNEGTMCRTNICVEKSSRNITVDFDEVYQAGKLITVSSHCTHVFSKEGDQVRHRLTIRSLKAPGVAGFFYRNFGSKNIGNAMLSAHERCYIDP